MAHIEARTRSIQHLIADVRGGRLRVPRYQRLFVWRSDQVLELLESVRRQYPIGTLFIWRTTERWTSLERIGAIQVPPESPPEGAEVGYVLDGHQRLSALVGTLGLTDAEALTLKGSDRVFLVYYDLEERRFTHALRPEEHHLSLRFLLPVKHDADRDPLMDFLREGLERHKNDPAKRALWDRYYREANSLRQTFSNYQVRYDDVTEATLTEALDIFVRVNRQGTPARKEDVFQALSYRAGGFDFSQRVDELLSALPGFEELSRMVVVRALLRSLDQQATEKEWTKYLMAQQSRLPESMDRVGDALSRAVTFLGRDGLHARHARILPSALQLVLLTRFFELCPEPDASQRARLYRWFWASGFGAIYGGAGFLNLDDHIDRAERLAGGEDLDVLPSPPPLQMLPRQFSAKSARIRVWHLFLATLTPLRPESGQPVEAPLREGTRDVRALVRGELALQLGARLLVGRLGGDLWLQLRRAQGMPWFGNLIRSHALPQEAFDAGLRDDFQRLVDIRFTNMVEVERTFALQFTAAPQDNELMDEPIIDVDDEGDTL